MGGTEIPISVTVMITECGQLFFQREKMVHCPLLMKADSSVASQKIIGKELIGYPLGLSLQDKILKVFYMRLSFGTQTFHTNGNPRSLLLQLL